jgi:two-component system, NarL family, response regulator DevR
VRVLVVDDSLEVRARVVAMLRELETIVAIHEAGTADEALAEARTRAPNVVILDVNLPGKTGLAILASLLSLPSAPLVIVLTNDPTDHHRRKALAGGARYFFDKSKQFDAVLEVLRAPAPTDDG